MTFINSIRKSVVKTGNIIIGLCGVILAAAFYFTVTGWNGRRPEPELFHPNGQAFAGSQQCVSCHSDISNAHRNTAHFRTSAVADRNTIKGDFTPGRNVYVFNTRDRMVAEARDTGFFQAGYRDDRLLGEQRMDVVIGSGTKGQSYLHWLDNTLVQLPLSYYTPDDSWSSSPGYPHDRMIINRPVTAPCLNCHSTFFNTTYQLNMMPEFDRKLNILGIDCERCHGPGLQHVLSREKGSDFTPGKEIINPARLSRQQQLDACAQCHSGINTDPKAPFTFLPGDSLGLDLTSFQRYDTSATAEVHGNQYGMLASSKCFIKSEMTCSTCHRPHAAERGSAAAFSARCITCHGAGHEKKCAMEKELGVLISGKCPDCHMPVRPSGKIAFRVAGGTARAELARSHFISVYREHSREIANKIRGMGR